jgi:CRISPR-associated protein Csy1
VLEKAFAIRASSIAWSETEHYKQLPLAQRIWLDDIHLEQRENQELWLETVSSRSFAGWIVHSYEATLNKYHKQ